MHNALVAVIAGLLLGVIVLVFVLPAFWSRKWSAERDFRRALSGTAKQFEKARFDPDENIAAFRKVFGQALAEPLSNQAIQGVRAVAPELAIFLEYESGKTIGNALDALERELKKDQHKWWSSVEEAQRERGRFADRIRALNDVARDKGECPSCNAIIPLIAKDCPKCAAQFGESSAWAVKTLM